jgi:beta-N-acetylhexosaminidase
MTANVKKENWHPIMVDVVGLGLDEDDVRRISHPLTGGVILFARNFKNRQQLTDLTSSLHAIRSDLLIAVDHEGGRVQRFKTDGFTHLPPMRRLGRLWEKDASVAARVATDVGFVLASELRACGVDFSFTPVLDLDFGASGIIGDRAFHRDPRVVATLSKSLCHGLLLAGMSNCGKHFPGHGFVAADSHVAVPIDERELEDIVNDDAAPYGWLGQSLSGVMPAHVIYPKVDASPAGFSSIWLSMLREKFSFEGVIFSDDLSMEGASVAGNVVDGAHAALNAGCDMVLICNAPEKADRLLAEVRLDHLSSTRHAQSSHRLSRLMPKFSALSWSELQDDVHFREARQAVLDLADVQFA